MAVAFLAPFTLESTKLAFQPLQPTLLTAFTSLFLHDPENILHLLGNLVFLAAVGPLVESRVGPLKFIVVYLLSGLLGVTSYWAVAASSGVGAPLIGASSAIAGCVGYCCVRYMRWRVPLAPKIELSVGSVALIWVMLQAIGVFVHLGSGSGTSFVSHVGGFLGGLILAFVFKAKKEAEVEAGREKIEQMGGRSPAAVLAATEQHLKDHPDDVHAIWEKADALHAMGERGEEAALLAKLARVKGEQESAVKRLITIDSLSVLSPIERMRVAPEMKGDAKRAVLMSVAKEPESEPQRPHALLALAEMSEGEERATLLSELKERYAFHAATELGRARGIID